MSLTVRMLMAALIAIVMACAACGGDDDEASPGSGELTTIADVGQFAGEFNADRGHPRLVLLLSPT